MDTPNLQQHVEQFPLGKNHVNAIGRTPAHLGNKKNITHPSGEERGRHILATNPTPVTTTHRREGAGEGNGRGTGSKEEEVKVGGESGEEEEAG